MQVTQQVFAAKKWVRDACNEARAKAYSRAETEKSLGALEQKQTKFANKLTIAERVRLNAEAGLKSLETKAEDQCKQLHMTEINLATQRRSWILRLSCKKLRIQLGWPGKLLR